MSQCPLLCSCYTGELLMEKIRLERQRAKAAQIEAMKARHLLGKQHNRIRDFFRPVHSPKHFITYEEFARHFHPDRGLWSEENRNIVDMHLRFRWCVREEMAPYKWIPILLATPWVMRSPSIGFVFPLLFVNLFDLYFQKFFIWKLGKERMINMRREFRPNVAKQANVLRKIKIFHQLEPTLTELAEEAEIPSRYLKYGEYTEYLYHSFRNGKEYSSILESTVYRVMNGLISTLRDPSRLLDLGIGKTISQYFQFRRDRNRSFVQIDTESMLAKCTEINQTLQCFNNETNVEHNLRRFIELFYYYWYREITHSNLTVSTFTNISKFTQFLEPHRYNIKKNQPDLLVYYFIMFLPHFLKYLRRRG